jgi:predicted phosphodiesterase
MHIALISDIHGNLVSLEAVLADIDRAGVDQIVCLGDVTVYGPQPRQVMQRLKALDCPCIMGNHDLDVLKPNLVHMGTDVLPWEEELVAWCADQLSEADLDFSRSFQPRVEIPLDSDSRLLCFHGSPKSNMDQILATTPGPELDKMLVGHAAVVMAGGHTHVQMLRQHKGVMLINPGSVGCPLEQMPFKGMPRYLPWAEYAIVNWVDNTLSVDLRRVFIDLEATKQAALDSDMPDAAAWVDLWIAPEEVGT